MAAGLCLRIGCRHRFRLGRRRRDSAAGAVDSGPPCWSSSTAQGINLLFFLPTAAAALLSHARAGRLDRPTLRAAVPAAAAAALAGAWIATGIDVSMLRRPFGIYLLLSGISLLLPRKSKKP